APRLGNPIRAQRVPIGLSRAFACIEERRINFLTHRLRYMRVRPEGARICHALPSATVEQSTPVHLKGVVDLDAEVAHGTVNAGVCSKVAQRARSVCV